MKFKVTVVVPSDGGEFDDKLFKYLSGKSFTHTFWNSIVPPNKREIIISGLTEIGVENTRNWFVQAYGNHPLKNLCSIVVKPLQ